MSSNAYIEQPSSTPSPHSTKALHRAWLALPITDHHITLWAAVFAFLQSGEFTCQSADHQWHFHKFTWEPTAHYHPLAMVMRFTSAGPIHLHVLWQPCCIALLFVRHPPDHCWLLRRHPVDMCGIGHSALSQAGIAHRSYIGYTFHIGAATAAARQATVSVVRLSAFVLYIWASANALVAAITPWLIYADHYKMFFSPAVFLLT
jgi:hypothetical protein